MNKLRTTAQTVSFALERRVFACMGAILLGLALAYTFLVMQSIAYVIEREEIVFSIQSLGEEVSALEQRYLSVSHTITEEDAGAHGLFTVSEKTFIERGVYTFGTINQ